MNVKKGSHKFKVSYRDHHMTWVEVIEENRTEILINSIQLRMPDVFYKNNSSLMCSQNLLFSLIKK